MTDIVWTTFAKSPAPRKLIEVFAPGIDRGRINFYTEIDCNKFLPELAARWGADAPQEDMTPNRTALISATLEVLPNEEPVSTRISNISSKQIGFPPQIDVFVLRLQDIEKIKATSSRIIFLSGIGGAGKSLLAAEYFNQPPIKFGVKIWRDCKEQSERFEKQITDVVQTLYGDRISNADLATRSFTDVVYLFTAAVGRTPFLMVLDNVDHYIDLESREPIGAIAQFCNAVRDACPFGFLLLTCRPNVKSSNVDTVCIPVEGFDLESTKKLFKLRNARPT